MPNSHRYPTDWFLVALFFILGTMSLFHELKQNRDTRMLSEIGVPATAEVIGSSSVKITITFYSVKYTTSKNNVISTKLPLGQYPDNKVVDIVYLPSNPYIVSLVDEGRFHWQIVCVVFFYLLVFGDIRYGIFNNPEFQKAFRDRSL